MMWLMVACWMQAANVTFTVTEIDGGLRVTPSNNQDTYLWQIVNEESLAGMAQYIGKSSLTVEEYWQAYIDAGWFIPSWDLSKGEIELIYSELVGVEDGAYTFIVAGCDEDGTRTGEFYKKDVVVRLGGELEQDTVAFQVTVTDITMTEATVSVVPSKDVPYYYDYVEAVVMTEYETEDAFAAAYVDFLKQTYGKKLSDRLFVGDDAYTFTAEDGLTSGTDYYTFAVAINMEDTTYMRSIRMVPFRTLSQPLKENFTFDYRYDTLANKVTLVPSLSDEPYYWAMLMDYEVAEKYNGDAATGWRTLAPMYGNRYKSKGESVVNLNVECVWEGTYYLTVAGFDSGQSSEIYVYEIIVSDAEGTTIEQIAPVKEISDVENAVMNRGAVKVLRGGRLFILHDGTAYDVLGR